MNNIDCVSAWELTEFVLSGTILRDRHLRVAIASLHSAAESERQSSGQKILSRKCDIRSDLARRIDYRHIDERIGRIKRRPFVV